MYKTAFPTLFHVGKGGPSFELPEKVSENEVITHLLRLYHRRFAINAQFLYYSHCKIQRRSVIGDTAAASESSTLQDVLTRLLRALEEGEAQSVNLTKTDETYVEKLTPQFSTLKGSPEVLAVREQKTFFQGMLPYQAEAKVFHNPEGSRYDLYKSFGHCSAGRDCWRTLWHDKNAEEQYFGGQLRSSCIIILSSLDSSLG